MYAYMYIMHNYVYVHIYMHCTLTDVLTHVHVYTYIHVPVQWLSLPPPRQKHFLFTHTHITCTCTCTCSQYVCMYVYTCSVGESWQIFFPPCFAVFPYLGYLGNSRLLIAQNYCRLGVSSVAMAIAIWESWEDPRGAPCKFRISNDRLNLHDI